MTEKIIGECAQCATRIVESETYRAGPDRRPPILCGTCEGTWVDTRYGRHVICRCIPGMAVVRAPIDGVMFGLKFW